MDQVFAVCAFKAPDGEMTARDVLEMFDEDVIHRCSAQRADDRQGLSRKLLRHNQPKARSYFGDKAHKDWAAFLDDPALAEEACCLGHGLSQHPPNGEISALGSIGRTCAPTQSKY